MVDHTYIPRFMKTTAGEFYFGAKCLETQKIVAIDADPDHGTKSYPHGFDFFPCHHCQAHHNFAQVEIFSFRAAGDE
jgi:hypothetical protein